MSRIFLLAFFFFFSSVYALITLLKLSITTFNIGIKYALFIILNKSSNHACGRRVNSRYFEKCSKKRKKPEKFLSKTLYQNPSSPTKKKNR